MAKTKKPAELGRFNSPKEASAAGFKPENFRIAGVHETTGPHWKAVLWVGNKPFVNKQQETK